VKKSLRRKRPKKTKGVSSSEPKRKRRSKKASKFLRWEPNKRRKKSKNKANSSKHNGLTKMMKRNCDDLNDLDYLT